jgi:predicted HAD superfamily Cof-like phosphohydrolase
MNWPCPECDGELKHATTCSKQGRLDVEGERSRNVQGERMNWPCPECDEELKHAPTCSKRHDPLDLDIFVSKMEELQRKVERRTGRRPFADVKEFLEKFGLTVPTIARGHALGAEIQRVRAQHLLEELKEYLVAVGFRLEPSMDGTVRLVNDEFALDAEGAFDALIDLAYVAIGTAILHRFKWEEGWARVHAANMKRVRVERADQSTRESTFDLMKPPGWKAPVLGDLLDLDEEENTLG